MPPPAGPVEGGGRIVLKPDEEVQARLRFAFDKFRSSKAKPASARRAGTTSLCRRV